MKKIVFGRWAVFPRSHRLVPTILSEMEAPNPQYQSAMRSGRPIIDSDGVPLFPERDRLYKERDGLIYVPRAYAETLLQSNQFVDRRVQQIVRYPKFQQELDKPPYTGQARFTDDIEMYLRARSGVIAQAETGFGKTVCINYVLFRLRRRALILVHTNFLMTQWEERLQDAGLKLHQIGRVQKDRLQFDGKCLVTLGMIQTILSRCRSLPKEFFRSFGVVVADEVHNMGATTFRKTITLFNPQYRIGISATPKRKDGCEKVFQAHTGRVAVYGQRRRIRPRVRRVRIHHELLKKEDNALRSWRRHPFHHRMGMFYDLVKIETYFTNHVSRNRKLLRILMASVRKGRKVLLLTTRLAHLDDLYTQLRRLLDKQRIRAQIGVFRGGMPAEDWAISSGCPVILGTYQIAKEALDLPALDALILAMPRADVIQPVGRILRELKGKKMPVVVDIVDTGIEFCEKLAEKRFGQYREKGWV